MVASDKPASGRQSLAFDLSDRQAVSIKGKVGPFVPDPRIDRNSLDRNSLNLIAVPGLGVASFLGGDWLSGFRSADGA